MSFSFVVVDKQNQIDLAFLLAFLNKNYADYEVLYCSSQKMQQTDEVIPFCFKQEDDTEQIINAVVGYCEKQNIVVIRKFSTCESIKALTDKLKTPNTIAYYQKDYSGIKGYFVNLFQKLANKIYSRNVLLANLDCIAYSANPSAVLKKIEYPSNIMRVFSWVGVDYEPCIGGQEYKIPYSKTKNVLKTIIPLILATILIALFFVLNSKVDLLFNVIIWLTVLICFVLSGLFAVKWFINSQLGDNILQKAEIIKD